MVIAVILLPILILLYMAWFFISVVRKLNGKLAFGIIVFCLIIFASIVSWATKQAYELSQPEIHSYYNCK